MEPILFIGGMIVIIGVAWTVQDLVRDAGIMTLPGTNKAKQALVQTCSGFRSRDISSSTACRAGLSQ